MTSVSRDENGNTCHDLEPVKRLKSSIGLVEDEDLLEASKFYSNIVFKYLEVNLPFKELWEAKHHLKLPHVN